MAKKRRHHSSAARRSFATVLLFCGAGLIVVSFFISAIFIKPSNFKQKFKQKQYEDCLLTDTSAQVCQQKFQ